METRTKYTQSDLKIIDEMAVLTKDYKDKMNMYYRLLGRKRKTIKGKVEKRIRELRSLEVQANEDKR